METRPKRQCNEIATIQDKRQCADSRGVSCYDGICKAGHRETFVQAALNTKRPVMYLDGPNAALTRLLLSRGVPAEMLVPVNNCQKAANEIAGTGVSCMNADICTLAAIADEEQYGAVWFDMCGVDFGDYQVAELVHCAEYKFFTLSCRQLICKDQENELCRHLAAADEKIVQQGLYTGLSGKAMNMVFVASKRNRKRKSPSPSSDPVVIGTVVKIPLTYWKDQSFLSDFAFKDFDGHLIGAVHSYVPGTESQVRISFQVWGGGSKLCAEKYTSDVVSRFAM